MSFAPKSSSYRPPWGWQREIDVMDSFFQTYKHLPDRPNRDYSVTKWVNLCKEFTASVGTDISDKALVDIVVELSITERIDSVKPYLMAGCRNPEVIKRAITEDIDVALAYQLERDI